MSDPVGNPEDRFSGVAAHFITDIVSKHTRTLMSHSVTELNASDFQPSHGHSGIEACNQTTTVTGRCMRTLENETLGFQ